VTIPPLVADERWLHTPKARSDLDKALELSDRIERSESDLDALARKIKRVRKAK
jgi:hypothetical protein